MASDDGRAVKYSVDEGKGARSMTRRAGLESIVPYRDVRRPAWSRERSQFTKCRIMVTEERTLVEDVVELEVGHCGLGGSFKIVSHCDSGCVKLLVCVTACFEVKCGAVEVEAERIRDAPRLPAIGGAAL